jgi:hypothetical protein
MSTDAKIVIYRDKKTEEILTTVYRRSDGHPKSLGQELRALVKDFKEGSPTLDADCLGSYIVGKLMEKSFAPENSGKWTEVRIIPDFSEEAQQTHYSYYLWEENGNLMIQVEFKVGWNEESQKYRYEKIVESV